MQNIYTNGITIEVETFDLSCENPNESKKIDLLFYNNINKLGEILTTLVFNSGIKEIDDTTAIVYNPSLLYNNSDLELQYVITGDSNRWCNFDVIQSKESLATHYGNSFGDFIKSYDVNTDLAINNDNGVITYDGWYTIMSVLITDRSQSIIVGTISDNGSGLVYLDNDGNWVPLTDIISDVPIYRSILFLPEKERKSFDFFVTTKTNSLYTDLLLKNNSKDWFQHLSMLRPKIRLIGQSIGYKDFKIAQHAVNSISKTLSTLLI